MQTISMNKFRIIKRKILVIFQVFVFLVLFMPSQAYAYVDPGSGSVIVTAVLGFVAAIGYTFRKYFYKVKRLITGSQSNYDESSDSDLDEQ